LYAGGAQSALEQDNTRFLSKLARNERRELQCRHQVGFSSIIDSDSTEAELTRFRNKQNKRPSG